MVLVGGIMRSDLTIELPDTASIKCSERSDIIGNLLIKKNKDPKFLVKNLIRFKNHNNCKHEPTVLKLYAEIVFRCSGRQTNMEEKLL